MARGGIPGRPTGMPVQAQGTPGVRGPGYGPTNMPAQAQGTPVTGGLRGFAKGGTVRKGKKKGKGK